MRFPCNKRYCAVQLSIYIVFIVLIFTIFEKGRDSSRSTRSLNLDLFHYHFKKQIPEDEAKTIPELGTVGITANVVLGTKDEYASEESEKEIFVNNYLNDPSDDNIALKDVRDPACSRVIYDAELPSVSVIIAIYKESYSVLLRTIRSVVTSVRRDQPTYKRANFVDRATGKTMNLGYPGQDSSSPFLYLKEIILVQDNSTDPELKEKISHYVRTRLPRDLVKLIRIPDQEGLIRARLVGSRVATADILLFLDAYSEVTEDWLRPLLQRIKDSNTAVVTPVIDSIDNDTFEYKPFINESQVCGFKFRGGVNWTDVPEWEKKRRGSEISPTRSPTMCGGIFAMDRTYFWKLGALDDQLSGWDSENIEISLRIWQCGGTVENIPCSHVGLIARSSHDEDQSETADINMARVAAIWMDDHAELFYMHRPDLRDNPVVGDVTILKLLRQKLQCKDFLWYLENVYREKFISIRNAYGFGRFMNPVSGLCLDGKQRADNKRMLLVRLCGNVLEGSQFFTLSPYGQLRYEEVCAEILFTGRAPEDEVIGVKWKVFMTDCKDKYREQAWRHLKSMQLQHVLSELCLEAVPVVGTEVVASKCRDAAAQRWIMDYTENYLEQDDAELNERERKLKRLRTLRPLLAVADSPVNISGSTEN